MIYILKNKQLYLIILLIVVVGIFLSNSAKSNFIILYLEHLNNISIRYFLITISVAIEYFIHRLLSNSSIISRYKSKQLFLRKSLKIEIILSVIVFSLFNLIVLLVSAPTSFIYMIDICIVNINIIIVYITISLMIKIIDSFVDLRYISSVIFIFLYVSFDFVLDHFNFFFFNNKLFDLGTIYRIYYMYENSIIYFMIIIILDVIMFKILNVKIKRKDFMIKNAEETE